MVTHSDFGYEYPFQYRVIVPPKQLKTNFDFMAVNNDRVAQQQHIIPEYLSPNNI